MKYRINIKNDNNEIIGWYEDHPTEIVAFSPKAGILGKYVKYRDVTLDRSGSIYSQGNNLEKLITEKVRETDDGQ